MKIGILNFHRALNYGAVLQCYGLQETLKSLGHDVSVIDYRPQIIEQGNRKYFNLSYLKECKFILFIKSFIATILLLFKKTKAIKSFDNFLNRYLNVSKPVITLDNVKLLDKYDIIFVGSDQVWSEKIIGIDDIFLGNFKREHVKYVSYAASLGASAYFDDPKQQKLLEYLHNYSKLSVREGYLKDWLKANGFDSQVTLDPSLLAPEKVFDSIAIQPGIDNYVLFIQVSPCDGAYQFAERLASQLDCKLVSLQRYSLSNKVMQGIMPSEYCGLVKYAKCVVTVSFHASAFSIVFRKDFYAMECDSDERSRNIMNALNLSHRLVSPQSNIEFSSIDYTEPIERLNELRSQSMAYIHDCINL